MTFSEFQQTFNSLKAELSNVIVGHERAVEHLLIAVCADGHVLLTGVPGLGRTLLVKSLARVLGLSFTRIQFTPDLLPTDITGTEVLQESADRRSRAFRFFKGPVFANLVLADEINRSPPRAQAALLEVMQERQVTIGGTKHAVPSPFLLVATQNSVETEGIFPLPEAQMDRFLMSIALDYPSFDEESGIVDVSTGLETLDTNQVATPEKLLEMQQLVRRIPIVPSVKQYALALVRNSRPSEPGVPAEVRDLLRWGASPRAGQALITAAKVLACVRGRAFVTRDDIREVAVSVLSHRLIPSFRSDAKHLSIRELIERLIAATDAQLLPPVKRRGWREILVWN